jgi:hypothetical protein
MPGFAQRSGLLWARDPSCHARNMPVRRTDYYGWRRGRVGRSIDNAGLEGEVNGASLGTSAFDQHTGATEMYAVTRQWLQVPRLPGERQRQWSIDQNGARYPPCAPCRRRDAGRSSRPAGSRAPGFYRPSELRRDIRRVDGVCINWRVRGDDGNHAEQRRRRRQAPDAHSRPRPFLCVGLRYTRISAHPSASR